MDCNSFVFNEETSGSKSSEGFKIRTEGSQVKNGRTYREIEGLKVRIQEGFYKDE